jgi:hypothetical protein
MGYPEFPAAFPRFEPKPKTAGDTLFEMSVAGLASLVLLACFLGSLAAIGRWKDHRDQLANQADLDRFCGGQPVTVIAAVLTENYVFGGRELSCFVTVESPTNQERLRLYCAEPIAVGDKWWLKANPYAIRLDRLAERSKEHVREPGP